MRRPRSATLRLYRREFAAIFGFGDIGVGFPPRPTPRARPSPSAQGPAGGIHPVILSKNSLSLLSQSGGGLVKPPPSCEQLGERGVPPG